MNSLRYRNLYCFLFSFPEHTGGGIVNIMAGALGGALIVTLIIIVLLIIRRRRRSKSMYDVPTSNKGTTIISNPAFGVPADNIHNDDVVYQEIADVFQEKGSSHNNDVYVEMHG